MGQYEVLEFLKQHQGQWFTIKEIAIILRVSQSNAGTILKKLYKWGYIERKIEKIEREIERDGFIYVMKQPTYFYKYKGDII